MSQSDSDGNNAYHQPQGSWYPPDAPSEPTSRQQNDNSTGGNRAPSSSNPYPHYPPNHFIYGHHPVPYAYFRYPYHYDGSDETLEDTNSSSEQSSNRRDSFPYYHHHSFPPQQQATPLQPPSNVYNGPPVSALVPRFPRGPALMYSQHGYTPNHIQFESSHQKSVNPGPPSTDGGLDSRARGSMYSKGRRTSFGLPIISSNPNFLIPTPQQHPSSGDHDACSESSSPVIPAPPLKENDATTNNETERNLQSSEFMNEESRCLNLLSKKFEPSTSSSWKTSVTNMEIIEDAPKKSPTVQDASLLLGLSSDASNNSSPATVPTLKDEAEAVNAMVKMNRLMNEHLPKTCFPVPVPKNYPKRLSLPNDSIKLNALHCFVRADLLEIFVVEPSPEALKYRYAPTAEVGRVGFRCVHCFMHRRNTMNASRDDEAPMSEFFPKTVSEIYRMVTSWQRCHVRKCKHLPKDVREKWQSLRETEKSRGKTCYWVDSANKIGLVDCYSRMGGVRFDIPEENNKLKVKVETDFANTTDENSEPSTSNAVSSMNEKTTFSSSSIPSNIGASTPLGSSNQNGSVFKI